MNNVLVMGGTGFIGAAVVRELRSRGVSAIVAGRRKSADWVVDLTNSEAVAEGLRGLNIDGVVNLMGRIDQSAGEFKYTYMSEEQLLPSIRFVEQLWAHCDAPLVHIGSNAEYGSTPSPQAYDSHCNPTSAYGFVKYAETVMIRSKARVEGRRCRVVRPFFVFGEGAPENNFVEMISSAAARGAAFPTTPGTQTRDMIRVDRVARQIVDALHRADTCAEIENACTGWPRTIRSVLEEAASSSDGRFHPEFGAIQYRKGEVMESCGIAFAPLDKSVADNELKSYLSSRIAELRRGIE